MAKVNRLTQLAKQAAVQQRRANEAKRRWEKEAQKSRGYVSRTVEAVIGRVYEDGDPPYIERLVAFVDALDRSSQGDVLKRRIRGLAAYLNDGEDYRERKQAEDEQRGATSLGKSAATYLRKKDIEAGNEPLSDWGYGHRIKTMASAGEIKLSRKSGQKRGGSVTFRDLDKVHEAYLPEEN